MSEGLDDLIAGVTGGKAGGGLGEILGGLAGAETGGSGGLGDILGSILGGGAPAASGGTAAAPGLGGMLTTLLPMLGSLLAGGGLQKILSNLQASGLSAQTDSWIGTGENEPISGDDVRQAIGSGEIARIAEQLGVSDEEAADAVARVLPVVVDRVSPGGRLRPDDQLGSAFESLEQLGS